MSNHVKAVCRSDGRGPAEYEQPGKTWPVEADQNVLIFPQSDSSPGAVYLRTPLIEHLQAGAASIFVYTGVTA
jgi:hypothetical protein